MRESLGKAVARRLFYEECLPTWLSDVQLRSGHVLVLLGSEPREIPYLDALRIPRTHVVSVERNGATYERQRGWRLRTSLHRGDLASYLTGLLHMNQGFAVLNLDIEGSYRVHLDPAMTTVLLFCWRNPETVVATYSSIGRDAATIWEGVKSLAVFRWLAPELTAEISATLCARYRDAGYAAPAHMALRDLFWLRSQLEHTAIASALVGVTSAQSVERFLAAGDRIWSAVAAAGRSPLRTRHLERIVAETVAREEFRRDIADRASPCIGVLLDAQQHVVYRAQPPWSHRCYFAKFTALDAPVACEEWVERALIGCITTPLTHIDRNGEQYSIPGGAGRPPRGAETVLGSRRDLSRRFHPRQLTVARDELPDTIRATVQSLRERLGTMSSPIATNCVRPNGGGEEVNAMPAVLHPKARNVHWIERGALTAWAREQLKDAAHAVAPDPQATTETVLDSAMVPPHARAVARRSAVAYLAVARRA